MRTRSIASALLAASATASAQPAVEIEAGAARVLLGTHDRESAFAATASLGFGAPVTPTCDAMLRGHVTIGDGVVTTVGPHVRRRVGEHAFLGAGIAIASVIGEGDGESRPRGIGLAADLRAGIRFGKVTLAVEALPIWVFANDAPSSHIGYTFELGIALGYQR
jgi:hypothetical protein